MRKEDDSCSILTVLIHCQFEFKFEFKFESTKAYTG